MGCFLGCFGTPNKGKRRKVTSRSPPRRRVQVHEVYQQTLQPIPTAVPIPEKLVEQPDAADRAPELRNDTEQLSLTKTKKKVKFDLNVTTYEAAPVCEETGISLNTDEQKDEVKEDRTLQKTEGNLTASSLEAYPVNHRYQYCTHSDDEISEGYEDEYGEELEDSDLDLDGDDDTFNGEDQEEESYDSYFSLQREKMWPDLKEFNSAKTSSATSSDMKMKPTVAASQSARDRSQYVHSVLNPVENLSQWKEIKIKQMPPKHSKKENICLEEEQKVPYTGFCERGSCY